MRVFFTFLSGVLICQSTFSQSPISLTSTNFPSGNDTLRYSIAQLSTSVNYTQTGTNFNWDFSELVPTSQGLRSYKIGLATPYAFFFIGLNEYGEKIADTLGAGPLTITNYYNFYKKQTSPVNAYVVDGSGMTFSSIPVPSYYSDKDELYLFPLTYPQYDSTTFKYSTGSSTIIPIQYSKTGHRVTKVDGWGTITTPYGTAACLRLETTQYSQDSIKNTIIPIPFGFPNNQRSYQWLTASSKIPFLEVSGNLVGTNFTITQIRYRDSYRYLASVGEIQPEAAFNIFPNPVREKLILNFKGENFTAFIFDINGKLVMTAEKDAIKTEKQEINVEKLLPGLYHLQLRGSNQQLSLKFIKQ
jgi:hypothetical protein